MDWQISQKQKELLDELFEKIEGKVENVLDIGSGRTSIFYLTDRYKDIVVEGIVYPGDERKIQPIKDDVENTNYKLIETDILDFSPEKSYDVVLAHLFLGEAEKFAGNKFEKIMTKLFEIQARYLVLVNLRRDNIDYGLLLKQISDYGDILKINYVISESEKDGFSLGMLIKTNGNR